MFKIAALGVHYLVLLPILTVLVALIPQIKPITAATVNSQSKHHQYNREIRAQVEPTVTSNQGSLEPEILSEINRARTNPQAYAAWLREQKQYYDGILLKLPGEKPVRTNRGLKALAEAIDFLEQQQPLPSLIISDELSTTAASKLAQIATTQTGDNFKNISYGKVTATGIVMHLIVDDGFPDRRHRTSIFNANFNLAGIMCQKNELYDNICALAYEGESVDIATQPDVDNSESSSELDANATTLPQPAQPDHPPNVEVALVSTDTETSDVAVIEANIATSSTNEDKFDADNKNLPEVPEIEVPNLVANAQSDEQLDTENKDSLEIEVSDFGDNTESIEKYAQQSEAVSESNDNPRTFNLLEKTKRGVLEEGDEIIPNDGSFYDSYPLKANAGDYFIISLESQDFDTFVAILDSEGNILDQNDDIGDNNSNSRLRVTLPDDGVYNIIVNAYDKGGQGRYTLTVRR